MKRLLALLLLAALAGTAAWRMCSTAPLREPRVELLMKESREAARFFIVPEEAPRLPFVEGSVYKLRCDSANPLAPLCFYMCSGSEPRLLYPSAGHAGAPEPPAFYIPAGAPDGPGQEWLELQNDADLETHTLVLLAADRPCRDVEKVRQQLLRLGAAPVLAPGTLVVLSKHELHVHDSAARRRSNDNARIDFSATRSDERHLLHKLTDAFGPDFAVVYAIAFPQHRAP